MLGFHGVVFQASSSGCVWGFSCAAQLNGMNPEHLFSSGVVGVADRPPHGPAAGPAIRPQPGRVSPGVTRRPRAVRSGRPSEGGDAEVPQRDLECMPRGFCGNGSKGSSLPPSLILIFCARRIARFTGISCWLA